MFSEFGCETLGVIYCLPYLLRTAWAGKYIIVMGWQGREFFYRGIADEFWEMGEENQWLRKYCKAFHHESRNLKRFEKSVSKFGKVVSIHDVANVFTNQKLKACVKCGGQVMSMDGQICVNCGTEYQPAGGYFDPGKARERARWIPMPSEESLNRVREFLPKNAVGIAARNRPTYGRNLPISFYEKLVVLLEDSGYRPVWFGEPASTYPCPFSRLPDFRGHSLSMDIENTLALVSGMEFTIQCYTASSRLAAMVGTPYLIVESPDQIWGVGQEGIRLNLLTKGRARKLVIKQFLDAAADPEGLLNVVDQGIEELVAGDYADLLPPGDRISRMMQWTNYERIGEFLRHE